MKPLTGEELYRMAGDRYADVEHSTRSDFSLRGDILAAAASIVAALDRQTEAIREQTRVEANR